MSRSITSFSYWGLQRAFATARNPRDGKPLGNNNRVFEESSEEGRAYRLEHFRSPIFRLYPDGAADIYDAAMASITSQSRLSQAGRPIHSERGVYHYFHRDESFIWSGDVSCIHLPTRDRPREGRGGTSKATLLPVVKAKGPRKLPKSRNTIMDPKVGDAFTFDGEKYIWVEEDGWSGRGQVGMRAIPYAGDCAEHRTYVHYDKKKTLVTLGNSELDFLAWVGRRADAEIQPIERFASEGRIPYSEAGEENKS
jgi:hypothetical protein